ncbi:unnamed protein product [Natator depressus]
MGGKRRRRGGASGGRGRAGEVLALLLDCPVFKYYQVGNSTSTGEGTPYKVGLHSQSGFLVLCGSVCMWAKPGHSRSASDAVVGITGSADQRSSPGVSCKETGGVTLTQACRFRAVPSDQLRDSQLVSSSLQSELLQHSETLRPS